MLNFTDLNKSRNLTTTFYLDAGIVSSVLTYVPVGDRGLLVGMGGTRISAVNTAVTNGNMVGYQIISHTTIAKGHRSPSTL